MRPSVRPRHTVRRLRWAFRRRSVRTRRRCRFRHSPVVRADNTSCRRSGRERRPGTRRLPMAAPWWSVPVGPRSRTQPPIRPGWPSPTLCMQSGASPASPRSRAKPIPSPASLKEFRRLAGYRKVNRVTIHNDADAARTTDRWDRPRSPTATGQDLWQAGAGTSVSSSSSCLATCLTHEWMSPSLCMRGRGVAPVLRFSGLRSARAAPAGEVARCPPRQYLS